MRRDARPDRAARHTSRVVSTAQIAKSPTAAGPTVLTFYEPYSRAPGLVCSPTMRRQSDLRVLVVSDERAWRATCFAALDGLCKLHFAENVPEVQHALETDRFSLALVSFRFQHLRGLAVVEDLQARPDPTPVLVVAKLEDTDSRKAAYRAGACAVIHECGAEELRLRVAADLRRIEQSGRPAQDADAPSPSPRRSGIRLGSAELSEEHPVLNVENGTITLTPAEHRILLAFAKTRLPVSRAQLEALAVGDPHASASPTSLDSHIYRLRGKLAGTALQIEAVKSFGFHLRYPPAPEDDDAEPASGRRPLECSAAGVLRRGSNPADGETSGGERWG